MLFQNKQLWNIMYQTYAQYILSRFIKHACVYCIMFPFCSGWSLNILHCPSALSKGQHAQRVEVSRWRDRFKTSFWVDSCKAPLAHQFISKEKHAFWRGHEKSLACRSWFQHGFIWILLFFHVFFHCSSFLLDFWSGTDTVVPTSYIAESTCVTTSLRASDSNCIWEVPGGLSLASGNVTRNRSFNVPMDRILDSCVSWAYELQLTNQGFSRKRMRKTGGVKWQSTPQARDMKWSVGPSNP